MANAQEHKYYEVKEIHTADDKNSAGHLAIQEYPTALETASIKDVEQHLIDNVNNLKTINYIYLKNSSGQLTGIVSIKELFRQPKDQILSNVMTRDIISVRPSYTKERVTYVAMRHHLKDIPVVDDNHTLLGVIPYNTIYNLAYKEAREDLMKFAGLHHEGVVTENIMEEPVLRAVKHRVPWLIIGLIGGIGMASIIGKFEDTLEQNLILAAYIPLIVYMSDAVGTQLEAYVIRDLAVNPKLNFHAYVLRQFLILFGIMVVSSISIFGISWFLYHQILISYTLMFSLAASIFSSMFTGLFIPKIFSKLKLDPANASGPIGTIIQDTLSVVIYLTVATFIL